MGAAGDKLVRTLKRKIQQNLSEKVQIKIFYTTNKLAMFCSVKDKIPEDNKSNVIYHIRGPGCMERFTSVRPVVVSAKGSRNIAQDQINRCINTSATVQAFNT